MNDDDHRAIGNRLDLFHFQEEAPGMVFWHPKGLAIHRALEDASRREVRRQGYREVRGPQLARRALWERSGHWEHFRENMFVLADDAARLDGGEASQAALKPVNCPGHLEIVRRMSLSYRDLPLRLSELGVCHRNEQSGALSGLFRLRQFVQDDGHVFCAAGDVALEVERFCGRIAPFYAAFGFDEMAVSLAGRPAARFGDDAIWDRAEAALAEGARAAGLAFEVVPGGGAFYGPKLEIALSDRSGRSWQCGTIQADFFLPERFDVSYVGADGEKKRPAMLHRALYGSLERFLGVLLEHHRGRLPAWLSPEQVRVVPLHAEQRAEALALVDDLVGAEVRAELGSADDGIAKRVAVAHAGEVPFVVVVGPREIASGQVDVRSRDGRSVIDRSRIVDDLVRRLRSPLA